MLNELEGGGSDPPSGWRSLAHSLHMHLTWNSTQLDSLRVLQEGEGEGRVCGQCKVVDFFCSWPGFYRRRVSLSTECLSATCNLKDCSNDALELCTNYAKWPNQLLFPSSAWCACLWMHCPIPFCLFLFLGCCCEEQLRLSLFFFFPFCTETKMVKWLFEHSICVWFVHFDSVQWHKLCLGLNILKDNRCFSYFSWFVFCCKCCKTVDKTVYNLLRQPFFGKTSVSSQIL